MKDKLQNALLLICSKVESNKYLGSIKEAFTMFVPFIIVGSFGSMLNILVSGANGLAQWFPWLTHLSPAFTTISFVSINCMSLPIAYLIGYKLAAKEKVPQLESGLIGLLAYLAVCPNTISTVVEGIKDPVGKSIRKRAHLCNGAASKINYDLLKLFLCSVISAVIIEIGNIIP